MQSLGIRHALVGGWAAVAWGVVRTTRDIDLLADIPATARRAAAADLQKAGFGSEWRGLGDLSDPIPLLLRLTPQAAGAPSVDIIEDARGILRVQGDKLDQTLLADACRARGVLSALKAIRRKP
ncbi:MAG: hypothetical protein HY748_05830 [Elusimicrobia bacterium]|nr:hypothetical protein [Elusimicrobiota bacterium]